MTERNDRGERGGDHLPAEGVRIIASASTTAQTGVEMEALTAASVAALTIYDMTKALDKRIEIQDIYLLEKTGGKSGDFRRPAAPPRCERTSHKLGGWL